MESAIRPEHAADELLIEELTRRAFATATYSSHTEHRIVEVLRQAGALTISLVAERSGQVVGHCAFSPVAISDGSRGWFGLGPVSVLPEVQNQGIGRALIEEGLRQLRERHAEGCVVLGEPRYYERFGFRCNPRLVLTGVPAQYFMALEFAASNAAGEVTYHAAFSVEP